VSGLIALDWGTSSLRVARIGGDGRVLEEHQRPQGILNVPAGGFSKVFTDAVAVLQPAAGTLCLASGMVGSRQGWLEAPYCPTPAGFEALASHIAWVPDAPGGLRVGIAPGMSTHANGVPDVMRGEEVQVFGALALLGLQDGTFVLPGTHSKWVQVQGGRITGFSTFMTGEVYAVLRRHSILGRTMPDEEPPADDTAFLRGVLHALHGDSLLHTAFSARTLSLFSQLSAESGPSYLSGLVIGEELRAHRLQNSGAKVVLVGSEALTRRYQLALGALGLDAQAVGAEATWHGLHALARTIEQR
jgi:2-dehydro-3-deoxygalactonokinase